MDFDRIAHPLRLARGSHQPGSGKGCAMNVIADERLVRPLLRGVNHSSEEIHVGDSQAGDQPRTAPGTARPTRHTGSIKLRCL